MKRQYHHISQDLHKYLSSTLESDILMEVFVSLLVFHRISELDDVHILPTANHRRNYENDVVKIAVEYSDYSEEPEIIKVHISRSSILDCLPESFYIDSFDPQFEKVAKNEKERKKHLEKRKQVIEGAKKFFRPLEIEYNRAQVVREKMEFQLVREPDHFLPLIWENEFPSQHPCWLRFINTLHLVSFVIGDKEKTEKLIEYTLGKPVQLQFRLESTIKMEDNLVPTMGNLALGQNFSLGNAFYCYIQVCTMTIQKVKKEEFYDFFNPQTEMGRLLKKLTEYYFPMDVDVELAYELSAEETRFSLVGNAVLGYATTL